MSTQWNVNHSFIKRAEISICVQFFMKLGEGLAFQSELDLIYPSDLVQIETNCTMYANANLCEFFATVACVPLGRQFSLDPHL